MKAIVYTSNSGYTAEYAKLLGEELNLPVYSLKEAANNVTPGTDIIYLGWLMAGLIKNYSKATKKYNIKATCGVGMMGTGEKIEDLRKANKVPDSIPVFSLQGGFDINKLHGLYKWVMKMMSKGLCNEISKKDAPSKSDLEMVQVLKHGGSYVCKENLKYVLTWYANKELKNKL